MRRYFIKVEDNVVSEARIDCNVDWTEDGFIEIEENPLLEEGLPLLYVNGELQINTEELNRRAEDERLRSEYDFLMAKLSSTDYVVIKIAEGVAKKEDYADVLKERAEWRKQINALEGEIK